MAWTTITNPTPGSLATVSNFGTPVVNNLTAVATGNYVLISYNYNSAQVTTSTAGSQTTAVTVTPATCRFSGHIKIEVCATNIFSGGGTALGKLYRDNVLWADGICQTQPANNYGAFYWFRFMNEDFASHTWRLDLAGSGGAGTAILNAPITIAIWESVIAVD